VTGVFGSVSPAFAAAALGVITAATAYLLSGFAARRGFLPDRPTARSSHVVATPRSGGAAIAAAFFLALAGAILFDASAVPVGLAIAATAAFAFVVGFGDDVLSLSAVWKFIGQLAAAGLFLFFFGPLEAGPLPAEGETSLGPFGPALTVLWIVGFMNAFNFMDGVNGMAAACGAIALAAIAVSAAFSGAPFNALVAALAGASLVGFLPVNFPKGRLFMGDGGSQLIGFLIAALALLAAQQTNGAVNALFVPTLMAPFLFDVAFTLTHRLARRRNVLAAHSEHLYQLAVRLGATHAQSTAAFAALTLLSAAAAFVTLRIDPSLQWIAPCILAIVFLPPGLGLYARARGAGLLAQKDSHGDVQGSVQDGVPQAAE